MTALLRRADRWLATPGSAVALGTVRLALGVFAVGYVLVRLPVFLALADASAVRFEPVGVLALLRDPLPGWVVEALAVGTVVLGVPFALGRGVRWTGPLFAMAFLLLTTYRSSWGQLLWFENLPALHLLVVGFSRSADAVVPGRRRAGPEPAPAVAYGLPIRLAALVTVTTYVLAGVAKVRLGGSGWLDGETLRSHVAYSAARLEALGATPSPFARPFARAGLLVGVAAVVTVVAELGAPLALLGRRLAVGWIAVMWSLHAGIAVTMFVVFPLPLVGLAFLPLLGPSGIDRLARRVRSALRQEGRHVGGTRHLADHDDLVVDDERGGRHHAP